MQRFGILTKTQIEKVHQTSLRILEEIGLDFGYPPALEVLKKGGAKVDGQRVFFPPQLVENQIKKAPSEFTLSGRFPPFRAALSFFNLGTSQPIRLGVLITSTLTRLTSLMSK